MLQPIVNPVPKLKNDIGNEEHQFNELIKEIHSTEPIDVIETSELGLAFLEKIKSVKYIIRLHGGHHFFSEAENRGINWWKGWQEKRSFKKADAFIAVFNASEIVSISFNTIKF